jgi:putative endonuclease
MPYVYMLRCADGSYYVGSTFNLERRLWQHNSDDEGALYTRRRRPVVLVWSGWYDSVAEAYGMEKQIQGWRREKREALINGRYDLLPELAASPDPPPPEGG